MKHTKVSLIATCTFAAVIILVVSRQTTSPAQATGDQKPGEWKAVEDVFGFPPRQPARTWPSLEILR
jgi:hypothetical protein